MRIANEIGLLREWAMLDLNQRLLPCEGIESLQSYGGSRVPAGDPLGTLGQSRAFWARDVDTGCGHECGGAA